jgi:phage terminase large subunit-like protein
MCFGESGIFSVFPKHQQPKITKKPIRVEFHTGAVAYGYNATEPDQLRGPQFDCAWCDELAKWRYSRETWDQLQFGLRLGSRPRQIITTTPRPIPVLKEILASDTTVVTRGITLDNEANLAAPFIKYITDKYAGTRLGRQELSAEILDDIPDALWTRTALDRDRRKPDQVPPLKRVVVAIDPAAKKNDVPEDGAATGIVVAGVGEDGRGYVLDDATCRESPNGWARMAVACFDRHQGDCIVGEINNGGDMVEATVRAVRPTVPFKEVTASRGKWTRAEPIAALYEQGRVSHVGTFASLEDEMVNFGPNGMVGDASPDRVDALVWALTELFPVMTKKTVEKKKLPRTPVIGFDDRDGHGWMAN